jgi:type VI protein secretion system component Hcp
MPPADQADPRPAAPGATCPPVPDLPGGQASVSGFADVDGIPGESTAAGHRDEIDIVTLHWWVTNQTGPPGGGGGRAVVDRSPSATPVRFCFDLRTSSPS